MLIKSILSVLILISLVNICVGEIRTCYFAEGIKKQDENTFTSGPNSYNCDNTKNFRNCYVAYGEGNSFTLGCAYDINDCEKENWACCFEGNDCIDPQKV